MPITKDIFTTTYTGRHINLRNFSKEDIDLRDIAVSLSRQRRYAGHTAVPWTVAQHITLCAAMADIMGCSDEDIKAVFLHDVEETWVQDVIFPIKSNLMLSEFKTLSRNISDEVYDFFGLEGYLNNANNRHLIKVFDMSAYIIEAFHMVPGFVHNQNLFDQDVNTLVTNLIENNFAIPQSLIDVDEMTMAQDVFEILNVFSAENVLQAPISSDLPEGITIDGDFKIIEKGANDVE